MRRNLPGEVRFAEEDVVPVNPKHLLDISYDGEGRYDVRLPVMPLVRTVEGIEYSPGMQLSTADRISIITGELRAYSALQ